MTGAAGAVGRVVSRALREAGHAVRGLDLNANDELEDHVVGDIQDPAAWDEALAGVDTLVHLAAYPDRADFIDKLLGPNVVGIYRAFEAAAAHKLRRVVFASTIQVISGRRAWGPESKADDKISPDEVYPTNHYALTKAWAEELARMYSRQHELSVIAARIGWFVRDERGRDHIAQHPGGPRCYVSHDDAGRFFVAAVEADHPGYGAYWCIGPGAAEDDGVVRTRFDLEPGRSALGYDPRDVFPAGSRFEEDAPASLRDG